MSVETKEGPGVKGPSKDLRTFFSYKQPLNVLSRETIMIIFGFLEDPSCCIVEEELAGI